MKKLTNVKKKQIRYVLLVIVAASAAALLFISIFIGVIRLLHPAAQNTSLEGLDFSEINVSKPEITDMLLTPNQNSRPGIALQQIKGIVVHYTANPGTDAVANRNYFESRKDCGNEAKYKVSSHYVIGLDGSIIRCIPEDEIAYASNDRNTDTLAIECCHPDTSGKFTENTYQSLIYLTAYLCDTYEIPLKNVIRHYDVTGKICPKYYVRHPHKWEALKKDILELLTNSRRREIN